MNEVEKLYRNAHVYPRVYGDITKETFENKVFNMADMCNEAFTADKLINLEMFLINKGDFDIKKGSVDITFESFTSCIAGLINNLWQDLTEEDKQQVKGILE